MMQWWQRSLPTIVAGAICGLSLLLILALLRRFFSRFSGFPPWSNPTSSKFQFDQNRRPACKPAKADVASCLKILIYLYFNTPYNFAIRDHTSLEIKINTHLTLAYIFPKTFGKRILLSISNFSHTIISALSKLFLCVQLSPKFFELSNWAHQILNLAQRVVQYGKHHSW